MGTMFEDHPIGFNYDVGTLKATIEFDSAKAIPREGMTLDELIVKMEEVGNKVIEVNREGNYLMLEVNHA